MDGWIDGWGGDVRVSGRLARLVGGRRAKVRSNLLSLLGVRRRQRDVCFCDCWHAALQWPCQCQRTCGTPVALRVSARMRSHARAAGAATACNRLYAGLASSCTQWAVHGLAPSCTHWAVRGASTPGHSAHLSAPAGLYRSAHAICRNVEKCDQKA
eukprot:362519-Chlamydomonas_euryale.AAC.1